MTIMKMEMIGDQVKPKETDYENSEVCGVRSSLPRKGEPTDHPPLTPANPQIPRTHTAPALLPLRVP